MKKHIFKDVAMQVASMSPKFLNEDKVDQNRHILNMSNTVLISFFITLPYIK